MGDDRISKQPGSAEGASSGDPVNEPTQAQTLAWVRERWPDRTDPMWRALKLGEEAGEVQGAVVKMGEGRATLADLMTETAQLVICAMALAESAGFDLQLAIAAEWQRCGVRVWGCADGASPGDSVNERDERSVTLYQVEYKRDEWTVWIKTPNYDSSMPRRTISAGSFNSYEAIGMLMTVSDPADLRAIARVLDEAADEIAARSLADTLAVPGPNQDSSKAVSKAGLSSPGGES